MKQNINLLLFLFYMLFVGSCDKKEEGIKASLTSVTESVYASVTVQPEELYNAFGAVSGILEKVYIKEGDRVSKGQVLAKITSDSPKIKIDNAQLSVELAQENLLGSSNVLLSIANEMEQLKEQIALDSLNYTRQQKLWNQGIGEMWFLENKQLQYEQGKRRLDGLIKKHEQTKLELESNLKKAKNSVRSAATTFNEFFIKSKIEGQVYTLFKNEGELISPQEPLAKIGKCTDFLIEMQIDESDIAKVKKDQLVLITLDAYASAVFKASITKIYPQKDERTQTFKVESIFTTAPDVLYAGLSGEANIVLTQKENVVTIPLGYLIDNKKVNTGNGEIVVVTGLRDMERVEIISGIDTSTVLLKP